MPRCSTAASVFSKVRELGTNNASIVTGNCFGQYSTIPKLFVLGAFTMGEGGKRTTNAVYIHHLIIQFFDFECYMSTQQKSRG